MVCGSRTALIPALQIAGSSPVMASARISVSQIEFGPRSKAQNPACETIQKPNAAAMAPYNASIPQETAYRLPPSSSLFCPRVMQ